MSNIGTRIKDLREEKNMTQREVAEKVNCTIASLCRYELGKREPTFEIVKRIANALEVSISELCDDERFEAFAIIADIDNLGENEAIAFCSKCKHVLIISSKLHYCENCGCRLKPIMKKGTIGIRKAM